MISPNVVTLIRLSGRDKNSMEAYGAPIEVLYTYQQPVRQLANFFHRHSMEAVKCIALC
jgi:hypothetical protein